MFEQFELDTPTHTCLIDITARVQHLVAQSGIKEGQCLVWVPHTTAGLTINENADPTVQSDLIRTLDRLVPWRDGYEHSEGNSAAHVKSSLLGVSHTVPVVGRRLRLGTWQGLYFAEFDGPRKRRVWVKVIAG